LVCIRKEIFIMIKNDWECDLLLDMQLTVLEKKLTDVQDPVENCGLNKYIYIPFLNLFFTITKKTRKGN